MYEVELKVEAGHAAVRRRLRELDAVRVGLVVQEDTYYDAPHREFAETDEALRVRRERDDEGTTVTLTYKGPLVEEASKTRREHETVVADGEETRVILERLGFDPAATVEKERELYEHSGYTVALDSVDGLGEFVEVETEADAVADAREGAAAALRELGLDPDEQLRTSYLGMHLGGRDAPE